MDHCHNSAHGLAINLAQEARVGAEKSVFTGEGGQDLRPGAEIISPNAGRVAHEIQPGQRVQIINADAPQWQPGNGFCGYQGQAGGQQA